MELWSPASDGPWKRRGRRWVDSSQTTIDAQESQRNNGQHSALSASLYIQAHNQQCPLLFGPGDTITKSNVFQLILAIDFMAFLFHQNAFFYFILHVEKEASASGGLSPQTPDFVPKIPMRRIRAQPLDPGGGLPSTRPLLCPPTMETDRRLRTQRLWTTYKSKMTLLGFREVS